MKQIDDFFKNDYNSMKLLITEDTEQWLHKQKINEFDAIFMLKFLRRHNKYHLFCDTSLHPLTSYLIKFLVTYVPKS